jgi:hypothetical protein
MYPHMEYVIFTRQFLLLRTRHVGIIQYLLIPVKLGVDVADCSTFRGSFKPDRLFPYASPYQTNFFGVYCDSGVHAVDLNRGRYNQMQIRTSTIAKAWRAPAAFRKAFMQRRMLPPLSCTQGSPLLRDTTSAHQSPPQA